MTLHGSVLEEKLYMSLRACLMKTNILHSGIIFSFITFTIIIINLL